MQTNQHSASYTHIPHVSTVPTITTTTTTTTTRYLELGGHAHELEAALVVDVDLLVHEPVLRLADRQVFVVPA